MGFQPVAREHETYRCVRVQTEITGLGQAATPQFALVHSIVHARRPHNLDAGQQQRFRLHPRQAHRTLSYRDQNPPSIIPRSSRGSAPKTFGAKRTTPSSCPLSEERSPRLCLRRTAASAWPKAGPASSFRPAPLSWRSRRPTRTPRHPGYLRHRLPDFPSCGAGLPTLRPVRCRCGLQDSETRAPRAVCKRNGTLFSPEANRDRDNRFCGMYLILRWRGSLLGAFHCLVDGAGFDPCESVFVDKHRRQTTPSGTWYRWTFLSHVSGGIRAPQTSCGRSHPGPSRAGTAPCRCRHHRSRSPVSRSTLEKNWNRGADRFEA